MERNLIEACRAHGLRITGQRRIITEVLATADDHPSIEELHRRVAIRDGSIALSTVYRTLKQLAALGLIEQHSFEGGRLRIEQASNAHHDHLIDVETGQVTEFTSPEIEALQIEIARRSGYELTGHRLELYGRKINRKPK